MSEPVVKQRPTIDLDEFERRMRGVAPNRENDPLAELARLVGEPYDPYNDVFAREASAPRDPRADDGRHEPGFDIGGAPRLFGDFAAIEAGLRGGHDANAAPTDHYDPYAVAPYGHDGQYVDEQGHQGWADPAQTHAGHAAQQPTKRPLYVMVATIAAGVIGIGVAFALKGHVSSSPSEVKTIMADAGPTKIQPPPDTTADGAGQDGTQVGKAGAGMPTSLVNRAEQPVDVTQATQDNAARATRATMGDGRPGVTDASTVPVPPSPRQIQAGLADPQSPRGDAIGAQVQSFGLSDMPAPKRVKVVSVRPDGTILPNDQPPAAALPAQRQAAQKPGDRTAPVAKASTPKTPAKTTSRVANTTPKSIEALASGEDAPVEAKPVKKPKPQRVAVAEPTDQPATDAAAPAADGGGFAVQLAAPGSEAEARAAASRLEKKFADALGERHLGFHKADSNGKSVYRVRVGSLSRADAVALCDKLKADGGSCFVAKN